MIIHHIEMGAEVILGDTCSRIVGWINIDPIVKYVGGRIGGVNMRDQWLRQISFGFCRSAVFCCGTVAICRVVALSVAALLQAARPNKRESAKSGFCKKIVIMA